MRSGIFYSYIYRLKSRVFLFGLDKLNARDEFVISVGTHYLREIFGSRPDICRFCRSSFCRVFSKN